MLIGGSFSDEMENKSNDASAQLSPSEARTKQGHLTTLKLQVSTLSLIESGNI